MIYDKLNRRGKPITHVTSSPPQLDKEYFTQKMYFTQKYSTETTCFRVFPRVSSLLAKKLGCKELLQFSKKSLFSSLPHLASIHLSSGSTACESDILFILFSLPLFLLKLSFRFLCWFTFSIVLSSNKTRREFEMESKEMIESWGGSVSCFRTWSHIGPYHLRTILG